MGTWKDSDEGRQIEIVLYVYTRLCNEVWTGRRAQLGLLHSESMQWCPYWMTRLREVKETRPPACTRQPCSAEFMSDRSQKRVQTRTLCGLPKTLVRNYG